MIYGVLRNKGSLFWDEESSILVFMLGSRVYEAYHIWITKGM